jgi:aspartyl-tRNA(Asn)/glutamyl-tRNA(Gln) amidotransferase subunit B
MTPPQFEPIIGLEIHIELSTRSKMFCQCDASWQKYAPNENTCPVCLGLPGALPVPNQTAVEHTIRIAQALGCAIRTHSHFDRKHYFYPDLPKGYQISQYDEPIGEKGEVTVRVRNSNGTFETKRFRIARVHLEEDTGKLSHIGNDTYVDFNRSGVPLVEIVTEPDFRFSEDVRAFLQELHTLITYLSVSNADMENGSMRLEPNISVRTTGSTSLPSYKVEVKNINSFSFVKKAVDYEVCRQIELLSAGTTPAQETRGWNEQTSQTYSQRSKEYAHDYRYFPEPDIPPMTFTSEYLSDIRQSLPELPAVKVNRYMDMYGVKEADAFVLTRDKRMAMHFEQIMKRVTDRRQGEKIASMIVNKKITSIDDPDAFLKIFAQLSKPIETDITHLRTVLHQVISQNQKSVRDYEKGKVNAIMHLVGQTMKAMEGKADATVVRQELERMLSKKLHTD